MISGARPAWPGDLTGTSDGERMLREVLDRPAPSPLRRSRATRWKVGGAVALGALLAGGASAAVAGYLAPTAPEEAVPDSGAFMCAEAGLTRMGEGVARAGETPLDACRRQWPRLFGGKAPQHLFGCVKRIDPPATPLGGTAPAEWGGLIYVVAGDRFGNAAETCGSVGMLVAPASTGTAGR